MKAARRPSGHDARRPGPETERRVAFTLHFDRKRSAADVRACAELALGTRLLRDVPNLVRYHESIWTYEPERPSGRDPRLRAHFVDAKTVARRKALLARGKPAGLPLRFTPFVPNERRVLAKDRPDLARHRLLVLTLPEFERVFRLRGCNPNARMYDIAYTLRDSCGLIGVYPDLEYRHYELFKSPFPEAEYTEEEDALNWHLQTIWARDPDGNSLVPNGIDGRGIVVGHPDTGWTAHSQLNFAAAGPGPAPNQASPNFDPSTDYNFLRGEFLRSSAREPVPNPRLGINQRYHGTRTASLIVSAATDGDDCIVGIAPGASIVSIRCVRSVVLISDLKVAQAINAAVDAGAHVISISLGGYPGPPLRWAIQNAVWNNVLVVAAAGNYWPRVVFPAGYPECVAVGGCNFDRTRWQYSSRNLFPGNRPIDIAAPARGIRNAAWSDTPEETDKGRDEGTSFATAIVAGAAALWLQQHGRQQLIDDLIGRAPLQALFQAHLHATATSGAGDWDTNLDGPGILNVSRLLDRTTMPIPSAFAVPTWAAPSPIPLPSDPAGPVSTGAALGPAGTDGVPRWMQMVFEGNAGQILATYAEELAQLIFDNPVAEAAAQAVEDAADAAAQAAEEAANAAAEVAEAAQNKAEQAAEAAQAAANAFADTAGEAASNALSTAAGWF